MVLTDTLEGTIDDLWWFHYDMTNDVLYLRLAGDRETEAFGEETPDGFVVMRDENERVIGAVLVSWWKRFGRGQLPDSIRAITDQIAPWTKKVAA